MKRFVDGVEVVAFVLAAVLAVMLFVNKPVTDLAVTAPGDPSAAGASPGGADDTAAATLSRGAQVYADRCAMCHAADGGGGSGPALAGRMAEVFPDPADQLAVVVQGRNGMPAFGGRLTPEELDAVVAYTRDGFG